MPRRLRADELHAETLRRAHLMHRPFHGWAAAGFDTGFPRREALPDRIGRAKGCGVREPAKAARSIREVKALVVDARMTGRTNAYAENVNRKIEDVKRRSCGFTKHENMRRRLLLAFGLPPLEKGGVPLPNYNE